MRNISIKWRMTLWFSLLMIAITALMLVFVMLMNRNTVTRPPEAELLYMVDRNADDVEFDHGDWDFSDVEQYAHGVYTEIFDEDGQRLFGTAPACLPIGFFSLFLHVPALQQHCSAPLDLVRHNHAVQIILSLGDFIFHLRNRRADQFPGQLINIVHIGAFETAQNYKSRPERR